MLNVQARQDVGIIGLQITRGPNHSDNWGKEVRGGNREGGGFEIVDHREIVENREWGK